MILGAPAWVLPAALIAVVAFVAVIWSYRHPGANAGARRLAAGFKLAGVLVLLLCLVDPLVRNVRATPGANQLFVLFDDSASLGINDQGATEPRSEAVRALAADEAAWLLRAGQDFDVQRFAFDARVRPLDAAAELSFAGDESALAGALARLAQRGAGRPVAGIVLITDGIATDAFGDDFPWEDLPPVYPVVVGGTPRRDIGISRIDVSQTGFEESPVTLRVDVRTAGCEGEAVEVLLRGEGDEVLERRVITAAKGEQQEVRFHAPPEASGVHFYRIEARLVDVLPSAQPIRREATLDNNTRWAVADRGAGPYRVLYVSGKPNWEFKFLRRALAEDPEVELVGLLRIARRQPKFTFRAGLDRRNTLWSGFEDGDAEAAEQYDEPVFMRLGTRDEFELRGGFPRAAEDLFEYDAIIIDDLEAAFFTHDQMALVEEFVSKRGGGFLALGGERAFIGGGYDGTPLGDLMPVYLDAEVADAPSAGFVLRLTREGMLEPWVRLRATEDAERERTGRMPPFLAINQVGGVKPGALVLIEALDGRGVVRPALAAQRFGKGRAAAMLVGDLWRWDLRRPDARESDLGTAWRQVLRWLVSDVPRRVDLTLERTPSSREVRLRAVLRDATFDAVHNAELTLEVQPPSGASFELDAVPSETEPGVWLAAFVPRASGPYRAVLRAFDEDGSDLGQDEAGWVSEPAADEFHRLTPDVALLAELAERTGGAVIPARKLESFAAGLARSAAPITEETLDPLWHKWWVLLIAVLCFCAEWGVRRFHGLP